MAVDYDASSSIGQPSISDRWGAARRDVSYGRLGADVYIPALARTDIGLLPSVGLAILVAVSNRLTALNVARLMSSIPNVLVVGTVTDEGAVPGEVRRLRPDVVVVDAEPPECAGLRVAAWLSRHGGPDVIVVAAAESYAASAFEAAALDYLTKPIRHDRLQRALDRARLRRVERDAHQAAVLARRATQDEEVMRIPDRHGGRDVPFLDIVWIQANKDYVLIHALNRSHLLRITMADLATRLPRTLIRVHRSAFVGTKYVRRWRGPIKGVHRLQLANNTEVAVGPSYLHRVQETLRSLGR